MDDAARATAIELSKGNPGALKILMALWVHAPDAAKMYDVIRKYNVTPEELWEVYNIDCGQNLPKLADFLRTLWV